MAEAAAITLARHFDSRAWRAAERAAALPRSLYQRVQARRPNWVGRWDPAARSTQIPAEAIEACTGTIEGLSAQERLVAFRHAVAAGAHLVASPLAASLLDEPGAIVPLHDHWIAIGESDKASAWRDRHAEHFTYYETLDPLGLAQEIDEGRLGSEELSALLVEHRARVLARPELHLLAHRAFLKESRAGAEEALNRYLRTQGSERVDASQSAELYLAGLQMASPAPVRRGPRVSVLIAAYNAEATIDYALRSVLAQSYQNLEVLLCDDHSSDRTLATVRERFANDTRLRLFRSSANQGSYNLRNALIARATGDLITVHDADDISLPRRVELQVAQLQDSSKKASVSNFLRLRPDGPAVFFRDRKACRMAIVSLMASREVFSAIGPYRGASFGADFEFLEKLKQRYGAGAVARIRSPQLFCLWSEASVTRSAASEALASGYRSPARRAYSDLVYRERVLGRALPLDAEMQGILREPAAIEELSR